MKKYKILNYKDRIKIEFMNNKNFSKKEIAKEIGCSLSTVYKELKFGNYQHLNGDHTFTTKYSADISEKRHKFNLSNRGKDLKIGKDIELAKTIEYLIVQKRYSPQGALLHIRKYKKEKYADFKVEIKSVNTIYSYIDKKVFRSLERKHLPQRQRKKRKERKIVIHRKPPKGYSIENRIDDIENVLERTEVGHWEGDTVCSKQRDKKAYLVLTERVSRLHLIYPLKRNTTEEVVKAFNRLERKCGADFYKIFQSITFDNGSEFKDWQGMEKAKRRKGKRFKVYYCHPNCPHERGSNENNNRLIRRHIPKGTMLSKIPNRYVKIVEDWISNYPRKIFNGKSSLEVFKEEYAKIGVNTNRLLL